MSASRPGKGTRGVVLPIHEWPTADRDAWQRALDPGDILEPGGPASRWSPATVWKHQGGYGRWLSYLTAQGQLDPAASPASRATQERVAAYARELSNINTPRTVICRLEELRDVLRVMKPQLDLAWISRMASRCGKRSADPLRKRSRLQPSTDLYDLGMRLMQEAEQEASGTRLERSVAFRDGLMIAFLAARPLRRGSFAALQLSDVALRGDARWLTVHEDNSKTRRPMEVPLPADLSAAVATYVSQHRPVLLRGAPCTAFWVSRARRPMGAMAIYMRITKLTQAAFGAAMYPHLFRDAAATTVAVEDPAHLRVAATLLGHRSLATTERHYNQARAIEAARRYQDFIVARRKGADTTTTIPSSAPSSARLRTSRLGCCSR